MVHVPYRGSGPAVTDMIGGQVQVMFDTTVASIEQIRAGKLRPLAVTSATRLAALPDVPAMSEFLPGFEASAWYGIGAPKNTPMEIIEKLNREVNAGPRAAAARGADRRHGRNGAVRLAGRLRQADRRRNREMGQGGETGGREGGVTPEPTNAESARRVSRSRDRDMVAVLDGPQHNNEPTGRQRRKTMRPTLRQCFRFAAIIRICGALAVILLALSGHAAWSQTAKAVKLVVPFPPGGGADTGPPVGGTDWPDARGDRGGREPAGGGRVIATETVSRAAPDGGTILLVANSFVINPNLKKLTYDPLRSFEPICFLTRSPNVLVVNNSSAYRTPADLFGAARAKPGELTMASVGPATTQHIAIAVLKRVANVNMIYVSFPGDAPAVGALLGDHVASAVVTYPAAAEQLKAGKLRALATASRSRIEPLPEVPTIAESGYPDYEADTWYGIVAPAKTPAATISQLAGWFSSALQATETKPKLIAQGHFPVAVCGADFATHLRKQYDDYGRAIREANIRGE